MTRVMNFGCRLNAAEGETIAAHARAAGLAGAVIVNGCAVTGEAIRQARQAVRRARREAPDAAIIVTGCAAQVGAASFAAMPEADFVLGNAEKLRPEAYAAIAAGTAPRVAVGDIMEQRHAGPPAAGTGGRVRAFLQVQTGCDHRCTFCIIPYGRGPSRSVPPLQVIAAARAQAAAGAPEIVLTGVDITAYGADLGPGAPKLGGLVRMLLAALPGLARLRLSSLDTIEADAELLRAIAEEPRLMPHFHLSLQHGDDLILKRMKRRHRRADAVQFCNAVRRARPDAAFGADLIAGFPTESAAAAAANASLIDDCGLASVHVFPFSSREGTPAARMLQLAPALVKARAAALRAAAVAANARHLAAQIGRTGPVLMESGGRGRLENFAEVEMPGEPGEFIAARIIGEAGGRLIGARL